MTRHFVAWQGWEFPVAPDWQPMKIEGDRQEGAVMIGLTDHPLMRIKWKRFRKTPSLDAPDWLAQRFQPQELSSDPPLPEGFASSAWILDHAGRGKRSITVWSGVCRTGRTVIEIMLTDTTPPEYRHRILSAHLPAMRLYKIDEEWKWSLYDIEFRVPETFALSEHRLCSGDIALLFRDRESRQLLLRQVYPANLALGKRSLQRWLEAFPFTVRRHFRLDEEQPWTVDGKAIAGIRRRGCRRIPSPLGWLRPRPTTAIAVEDRKLDRLLIAECCSPAGLPEVAVELFILGMNASYRENTRE